MTVRLESRNKRVSLAARNDRNALIRQQTLPFVCAVGDDVVALAPSASLPPRLREAEAATDPLCPETQHNGCTRIITTHPAEKKYL